jgi:hypothetical protein
MIEESLGAVENRYVFVCDGCGVKSRTYHGPDLTVEDAVKWVTSRKWKGQGQDWRCPICRVSNLRAKEFDEGCTLGVPSDLSEDLANHFAEHELDCGLTRTVLGEKDVLSFSKGVSPQQVEATLRKWDAWPLLLRQ